MLACACWTGPVRELERRPDEPGTNRPARASCTAEQRIGQQREADVAGSTVRADGSDLLSSSHVERRLRNLFPGRPFTIFQADMPQLRELAGVRTTPGRSHTSSGQRPVPILALLAEPWIPTPLHDREVESSSRIRTIGSRFDFQYQFYNESQQPRLGSLPRSVGTLRFLPSEPQLQQQEPKGSHHGSGVLTPGSEGSDPAGDCRQSAGKPRRCR